MTWNLVTYAYGGKLFNTYQNYISDTVEKQGLKAFRYGPSDLKKTTTYKENKDYFVEDKKYGWCSWKPLLVLEAMKSLEEGDKIVLCDTEDILHPSLFDYVDQVMGNDPCLLVIGGPDSNKKTTKRDCFVFMGCDEEDYWESQQLEAGITFWRVCDEAKAILEEWLKWCLDERVNGEDSNFSGKPNFSEFNGYSSKDQSILTNIAIRDGLCVDNGTIRNFIECNADSWYQRYFTTGAPVYRPVDHYMLEIQNECVYANDQNTKHSLILTIHNKGWLINRVIESICKHTVGNYELIVVFDGCTDNSEQVAMEALEGSDIDYTVVHTPDVFETKANNAGIKKATGDYVIIIQDDIIIEESGWNRRMQKPFNKFDDVFAVSANYSHNYILNTQSKHLNMEEDLDNCWCDILQSVDEASFRNIPRDTFAVRATVNRGPLMINHSDLKELGYFDEAYSPQDMDDHDLMFRAHKKLGKKVGCYWIHFTEDPSWGGTRVNGQPARWLLKTHHKNSKIFYSRNKDVLDQMRIVENRKVS